jgi:1-acyl-sn-glycerol-3-phosphate acyltransferase
MNGRRLFRTIGRFFQFAGIVIWAISDYWIRFAFRPQKASLSARALWLQRHSRRTLRMFRLVPQVSGTIPTRGLLISNHLSYLDVIVIASITPAILVAKKEIRSWPALGLCAQMAGTLFVDRERRMHVGAMNDEIQNALDSGVLVVLFPEGTSTNGQGVLPFRSALLEPAARHVHSLSVSCLQYALEDGDASNEVCYWGDHTFFPHMLNLLGKQTVRATVRFAPFDTAITDRKELARLLREKVLKLKEG